MQLTACESLSERFCTNNLIPKEPLAEHFVHLTMECSVLNNIFQKWTSGE